MFYSESRFLLFRNMRPAYTDGGKVGCRSSAMARKPTPKPAARSTSGGDKPERERIIDAFMTLLAAKPIERIGFAEIAKEAGVALSDLRGQFGSTLAILAAQ